MQSLLSLAQRVETLVQLGKMLDLNHTGELESVIHRASIENPWFTQNNIEKSIKAIRSQYLSTEALQYLVEKYHLDDNVVPQRVALILAGNIPLVGWHDVMCCFLTGHIAVVKLSEKDTVLMKYFMDTIIKIQPGASRQFDIVDRIKNHQAAIATGSNTSAQHFKYYFSNVPHIIRANRNSIAVLHGDETVEQLQLLGQDIFSYFGLGCRNVSKIFVPRDYDLSYFIEALTVYEPIIHHNKYKNNYDYNLALMLLNKEDFLQGPFFLLKESEAIVSRIASLHYQRYDEMSEVTHWVKEHDSEIQCVLSSKDIDTIHTLPLGEAQCPTIDTWADGVDTIQFLLMLQS